MNNDKPIILAIKEVEAEILNIITQAGLPAFFLRYILNRLEKDLILIESNELEVASKNYKESLEEKEEN